MDLEEHLWSNPDKRITKVLMEFDLSNDLLIELDIIQGDQMFIQKLDFWKMHFCCSICHEVWNIWMQCRAPNTNWNFKQKNQIK